LERLVRQVSQELKKEVHLDFKRIEGEIDRSVLEKLISPLEHMLRNALDHGIESLDTRLALKKPSFGTISLSFYRKGNEIIIEVKDDGAGLNIDAILQKSIQKKLWDKNRTMSKEEAMRMIFFPGFSTKESISAISGQGIGMDVVNAKVQALGGTINVKTQENNGVLFTICLPAALSLHHVTLVESCNKCYGFLLENLAGISQISAVDVKEKLNNKSTMVFDSEEYNCFSLAALLSDSSNPPDSAAPVIFLRAGVHHIALVVDKLIGNQEVIIKPVGAQLSQVKAILGVSLLGNGAVVLMIDIAFIAAQALALMQGQTLGIDNQSRSYVANNKVLVVDDSITIREATAKLLRHHDYDPVTAKNGQVALSLLESVRPDIILLDIEMPVMDGFGVLESVRADPLWKEIPIVVISSRSSEEYQSKAFARGANAYLTKPYSDGELLALISKTVHRKSP